ncbi:MAG: hypothetical protein ACTSPQ_22365 [Candidatus Helarchaeota archaeon]
MWSISDIIQLCTLIVLAPPVYIAVITYLKSFNPNIIVFLEKSSQGLFVISIKNSGSTPAYNICIKTDKVINNSRGKILPFNDFSFESISSEEIVELAFDDDSASFLNAPKTVKKFNIKISYSKKPNGKKIFKKSFGIDCEKYRNCIRDFPRNLAEAELINITKMLESWKKYICKK